MSPNPLVRLSSARVLVRSGGRRNRLRVNPRFLAHAEGTAGRLHLQGRPVGSVQALEVALTTWDGFAGDACHAAAFLETFLADRHQLGALRPVFPVLESFAVAA